MLSFSAADAAGIMRRRRSASKPSTCRSLRVRESARGLRIGFRKAAVSRDPLTDGTLARTMRRTSKRVNLESDIKPVSEFRANAAGLIDQVRSSGRPLVLTQRGHSAAVLLDVTEYERLLSEIELLRDVRESEDQIAADAVLSNRDAKAELRRRLRR